MLCMGSCLTCCDVCPQFRITATRQRKVKFCCVVWRGIVTFLKTDIQRYKACRSSDWYNMKLFYVPITICVHLSICRLWGAFPVETHWRCYWSGDTSSCRCWSFGVASVRMRTHRGAERMPVVVELLTCLAR